MSFFNTGGYESIFSATALANKHILVTGASGGIGEEVVHILLSMGAKVTASGRNIVKLESLKKRVSSSSLVIIQADITKAKERNNLVNGAIQTNGPLYGLVNAAATTGVFGQDTLEKIEEEHLTHIMNTNWTATVLLTQLAYEEMQAQQEGAIVNISSLSGLRGTKGNIPYASSKFALIGFTQSFAHEAIAHGIRVNAICCPGYVDTEMGYQAIRSSVQGNNRTYEEQLQLIKHEIPSGRITKPEEVAHMTAFLLTNAAQNIVGESIKISGGVLM